MTKTCNAEIGKPGAWHICQRKAVIQRRTVCGIMLYYCRAHMERAINPKPEHYEPAPFSESDWLTT